MPIIDSWLTIHDPAHNQISPEAAKAVAAIGETKLAPLQPATHFSTLPTISIAKLGGTDVEAAQSADKAASDAFQSGGATSPEFAQALAAAPATAVATLLEMARLKSGFDPQNGITDSAKVNAYMQSIGTCPFLSFKKSSAIALANEAFTDEGSVVAEILENLQTDDAGLQQSLATSVADSTSAATTGKENQSTEQWLYYFTLVANQSDVSVVIAAAKVTLVTTYTETQVKPNGGGDEDNDDDSRGDGKVKVTIGYQLSCKGLVWDFGMIMSLWNAQTAGRVGQQHFATIDEWIKNSSTPSR